MIKVQLVHVRSHASLCLTIETIADTWRPSSPSLNREYTITRGLYSTKVTLQKEIACAKIRYLLRSTHRILQGMWLRCSSPTQDTRCATSKDFGSNINPRDEFADLNYWYGAQYVKCLGLLQNINSTDYH